MSILQNDSMIRIKKLISHISFWKTVQVSKATEKITKIENKPVKSQFFFYKNQQSNQRKTNEFPEFENIELRNHEKSRKNF